jgi:hypothetical protein
MTAATYNNNSSHDQALYPRLQLFWRLDRKLEWSARAEHLRDVTDVQHA